MKRIHTFIAAIIILCGFSQIAIAQDTTLKSETWYVWIDVEVPLDDKMVNVVSNVPFVITCCPKSAKYRKFVKKAAKWITQNVAPAYNGELLLMKIQDKELASETVTKLKEREGVFIIDYVAVCK